MFDIQTSRLLACMNPSLDATPWVECISCHACTAGLLGQQYVGTVPPLRGAGARPSGTSHPLLHQQAPTLVQPACQYVGVPWPCQPGLRLDVRWVIVEDHWRRLPHCWACKEIARFLRPTSFMLGSAASTNTLLHQSPGQCTDMIVVSVA
jgi:hypothetical protein